MRRDEFLPKTNTKINDPRGVPSYSLFVRLRITEYSLPCECSGRSVGVMGVVSIVGVVGVVCVVVTEGRTD